LPEAVSGPDEPDGITYILEDICKPHIPVPVAATAAAAEAASPSSSSHEKN